MNLKISEIRLYENIYLDKQQIKLENIINCNFKKIEKHYLRKSGSY